MASKFTEGSHRFSDVADEPQRRLPPLQSFETMPLVTLEEATRPLIPHVPEIEHMVHTVKEDKRNQPTVWLWTSLRPLHSTRWSGHPHKIRFTTFSTVCCVLQLAKTTCRPGYYACVCLSLPCRNFHRRPVERSTVESRWICATSTV